MYKIKTFQKNNYNMPASLSNQIRLGFSLGWRIWTPNEVGFYAKTLAHSYFIFTILKAKFFTKKLWVVNYSIFVAAMKYLVFVEFIEFGIKTKEERTYWKKIMYISLLIRHAKYKSKLKYTANFEKMKTLGRFFRKLTQRRRNRELKPKIWAYFKKSLGPSAIKRRDDSESHKKTMGIVTNFMGEKKELNLKFYKLELNIRKKYKAVSENRKTYRKKIKKSLKRSFKNVSIKLQSKINRWSTKAFPDGYKIVTQRPVLKKKIVRGRKAKYKKSIKNKQIFRRLVNFDTIAAVLGRKLKHKNKKLKTSRQPTQRPIIRIARLENERRNNIEAMYTGRKVEQEELRLKDRAELIHAFKSFIRKRHESAFSVTGGPRKRLFRNIKRSFQGKFIVHYASLVWFWEKISRLITYIVKKLTQSTVSAFRIA